MVNPNECQFCYKKTTPANKARHLQTCPVKKAGGAHSNKVIYVNSDPNKKKERFVTYVSGQAGSF